MRKVLCHGTTRSSGLSILKNGFDFSKCGSNWGSTYGKGIYFTPDYKVAKTYAGDDGIVLSFSLNLNCYQLQKDVRPSRKRNIKIPSGYNCLISPNKEEYVVYYFL